MADPAPSAIRALLALEMKWRTMETTFAAYRFCAEELAPICAALQEEIERLTKERDLFKEKALDWNDEADRYLAQRDELEAQLAALHTEAPRQRFDPEAARIRQALRAINESVHIRCVEHQSDLLAVEALRDIAVLIRHLHDSIKVEAPSLDPSAALREKEEKQ